MTNTLANNAVRALDSDQLHYQDATTLAALIAVSGADVTPRVSRSMG
jgi:hypothetical protein